MSCGNCNACCTRLVIEDVFFGVEKPKDTPCQHLCKKGCSVYDKRPAACRSFKCIWLQVKEKFKQYPNKLRPDKTGMMAGLESNSDGTHRIVVDEVAPNRMNLAKLTRSQVTLLNDIMAFAKQQPTPTSVVLRTYDWKERQLA